MAWTWSETEFEPPEPSRSELLRLRNRRVHGVDDVMPTTCLPTSVGLYGGGEEMWTSGPGEGERAAPPIRQDHKFYGGGSFVVSTAAHPEREPFDLDVVAFGQEGEHWDVDEWKPMAFVVWSKAVTDSATPLRWLRDLLRRQARDERIRELPPARRALFERIRAIREKIPPSDFDSLRVIRELRGGS